MELGVVVRPHGVYGDLLVKLFNPNSDLIFRQDELIFCYDYSKKTIRLERIHPHGDGFVIITIAGCNSRTDANEWRGFVLCVARGDLPELPANEFYHTDLIDLGVVTPDGSSVGTVEEVIAYPTVDTLRVAREGSVIEIPLIEPYLVQLDLDAGRIVVDHLDDFEWTRPKRKKKR